MLNPSHVVGGIPQNLEIILAVLGALFLVMLICLLYLIGKVSKLIRLYQRLTRGTSGGILEEILDQYMGTVNKNTNRMDQIEKKIESMEATLENCLQRVGVVRYDAFEDVGGAQSFALAIIDSKRSGIVMSSVFSRNSIRVYAKGMSEGQPTHPLTKEEMQALDQAAAKKVGLSGNR